MNANPKRCGYVALIGKPNVGKSTLLNALVGQKISITTRKPQTTREQIAGIATKESVQMIFIDTPGFHKNENKRAVNRYMNRLADSAIADADVILFLVDRDRWFSEDEVVLEKIAKHKIPIILVINKIDTFAEKQQVLPIIDKLKEKHDFQYLVPVSAKKMENIDALENVLATLLPEGPHLFSEDQITDSTDQFRIAEAIREKIIMGTGQELPYSISVAIESMKITTKKILEINAIILVDKESQKPIVIGKNGERLKEIGTKARIDIEKIFSRKVFLRLWVRVNSY